MMPVRRGEVREAKKRERRSRVPPWRLASPPTSILRRRVVDAERVHRRGVFPQVGVCRDFLGYFQERQFVRDWRLVRFHFRGLLREVRKLTMKESSTRRRKMCFHVPVTARPPSDPRAPCMILRSRSLSIPSVEALALEEGAAGAADTGGATPAAVAASVESLK